MFSGSSALCHEISGFSISILPRLPLASEAAVPPPQKTVPFIVSGGRGQVNAEGEMDRSLEVPGFFFFPKTMQQQF